MQRDLEATIQELNFTRNDLTEKEQLLRNRDTLLESTGLQVRQSTEALERERQLRRQEAATFENAKRGHQSVTRTIQQHETRVLELESLRSQDRQKLHNLEKQYREQLLERNNLLYALWNRLSTLCGAEWCRSYALVNGELTSMELISRNIKGFNSNMINAVKTVEGIIGGFKQRIRATEKDLLRDYQTLEHTLDGRIKRLEQLEKSVLAQRQSIGRPSTVRGGMVEINSAEINKLRNENKTLRTEVQTLRAITSTTQSGDSIVVSKNPLAPAHLLLLNARAWHTPCFERIPPLSLSIFSNNNSNKHKAGFGHRDTRTLSLRHYSLVSRSGYTDLKSWSAGSRLNGRHGFSIAAEHVKD